MRLDVQQQMNRIEQQLGGIQRQLEVLQFNAGAATFNSSAVNSEASIRPFIDSAGNLPVRFPATLREFQDLPVAAARGFLRFYRVRLPRGQDAKRFLASHIGLRAAV